MQNIQNSYKGREPNKDNEKWNKVKGRKQSKEDKTKSSNLHYINRCQILNEEECQNATSNKEALIDEVSQNGKDACDEDTFNANNMIIEAMGKELRKFQEEDEQKEKEKIEVQDRNDEIIINMQEKLMNQCKEEHVNHIVQCEASDKEERLKTEEDFAKELKMMRLKIRYY